MVTFHFLGAPRLERDDAKGNSKPVELDTRKAIALAAYLALTARAHELGFGEQLSPQMACTLEKAFARIVALCEFLNPTCLNVSRIMQDVLPLPSSPRAPKLHKSHQYA